MSPADGQRPLRFCMVTTFYPPYNFGGDGIFVQRLANELARRGHTVEVLHSVDAHRALHGREPTAGYEDHPNVTVHGIQSGAGLLAPLAIQQTGRPLLQAGRIQAVLEREYDVIHYHNVSLVGGPKVLEYGRALKLYTMHEYWLICPTHVLFRFNREACTRRTCFACTLAHRRPPQWWRYTDLLPTALRHVDLFLAPSRFSAELHRRLGLVGPIEHLPLFVPPLEESAGDAGNEMRGDGGRPYFLFVGRLEKLKGVQSLIPIFRSYGAAELLVVGEGSYELHLRRLAGGAANVRFLGRLPYRGLGGLYRGALALIVPSLAYESAPLVALEAFQHGTPVIVRDLGGMPELVETSGAGFTYRTDAELRSALDRLAGDPAARGELGARAQAAYRREWTPDVHLRRYFELIEQARAGSIRR